jgi:hypothetical protein
MPIITKKNPIWKKDFNLYASVFWGLMGISFLFISENYVSGVLNILLAISYFSFHLYNIKKGRNKDYIKWDNNTVIVGRVGEKPLEYSLNEIQSITHTPNNLIIISGAAAGTMVELNGFSNEDLELLKARFHLEVA